MMNDYMSMKIYGRGDDVRHRKHDSEMLMMIILRSWKRIAAIKVFFLVSGAF